MTQIITLPLQLRYLQTLNSIAAEHNSTIIFPMPIRSLIIFTVIIDALMLLSFQFGFAELEQVTTTMSVCQICRTFVFICEAFYSEVFIKAGSQPP